MKKKIPLVAIIAVIIMVGSLMVLYDSLDKYTATSETTEQQNEPESGLTDTITIGSILPLSGASSSQGEDAKAAVGIAVSDFNKHLKSLGENWELDIVIENSETNPVIALEKLNNLHAKGVSVVVGPYTSADVSHVKTYADSNDVLILSHSSSAVPLSIPDDNVFRFAPDDSIQGRVIAKVIYNEGITMLIPIWRGDIWGDGMSEIVFSEFESLGGTVGEGVRYNPDTVEFSSEVSFLAHRVQDQLSETSADKIGVLDLSFAEVVPITQTASQYDILDDVRWFGAASIVKESRLINDQIAREFSENAQFMGVQFMASESAKHDRVEKILESKLGRMPSVYGFTAYDVVWVIGLSMLESDSSDAHKLKKTIPQVANNYHGAIGSTRLNDAGDLASADFEVWGIQNGEWVLIAKYLHSTDTISKVKTT